MIRAWTRCGCDPVECMDRVDRRVKTVDAAKATSGVPGLDADKGRVLGLGCDQPKRMSAEVSTMVKNHPIGVVFCGMQD